MNILHESQKKVTEQLHYQAEVPLQLHFSSPHIIVGMKILLVEDDKRIAQAIKKGLEQERYVVDLAFDGEEGLDLGSSEEYDLFIFDIMLPNMDGVELAKMLRQKQIVTPILFLTAKSQVHEKVTGLDAGADDYLTKPFAFEELLARIRALLRRPKSAAQTVLSISNLTLNPKEYLVERAGKSISLSHKEFSLLEYLMRNAGTILSKQQIMNHVWSFESDILPNTVEVYMRNLRKKIDEPFHNQPTLLHTVRGFGYKIGE